MNFITDTPSNLERIELIHTNSDGKVEIKGEESKHSLSSAILFLAGSIIGTGIFMTPNFVVQSLPSILYSLLMWVFCGVVSFLASLCYAELGLKYPGCGGEYDYFKNVYHDIVAFSYMFTNFFFIKPVCIAILVLFFGEVSNSFIPYFSLNVYWMARVIAIVSTILICILNCYSEKLTIKVNDVLTLLKFICMICLIGISIYKLCRGEFEHMVDPGLSMPISFAAISSGLYNGMWAYDGFNQLGFMVSKIKNPKRNLVLASGVGLGIVVIFYVIINLSYLVVLGVKGLAESTNVAYSVAYPYLKQFTFIITGMVGLSALATANATAFCGGNIYVAAAKNGHFPRLFASIQKKTQTAIPSLIIQALLTIVFLFVPDINTLLLYFSGASWVYYSLTFIAVIVSRSQEKQCSFELWIGFPVLTAIISVVIVILGFIQDWVSSLISVSLIIGSIPIYFIFVYNNGIFPEKSFIWFEKFTYWNFKQFNLTDEH